MADVLPKMWVANEKGHKMGINEADFDPDLHTPWETYVEEHGEEAGPVDAGAVKQEIEDADSLGALASIAVKHGLKFPGNVKKVETAREKLLAQLGGDE